jgi:hypothetical protein
MKEMNVQDFWQNHPCGEMKVGGLENFRNNYEIFFTKYDEARYDKEGHGGFNWSMQHGRCQPHMDS